MAAIYSNGGNRWNILGFNFTKRDALSSVYKISMPISRYFEPCYDLSTIYMKSAVTCVSRRIQKLRN